MYRFPFLLATLLTLPFAIRKVFWVPTAPFFKEYSDISVYLFEIFLAGYVLLSILEHINNNKSILQRLFHVEHILIGVLFGSSSIVAGILYHQYYAIFFLFRWTLYILFGYFLYQDLVKIVPRGTKFSIYPPQCSTWNIFNIKNWKLLFHVEQSAKKEEVCNCSTWNNLRFLLLLALFIEAVIVILQVINQRSVGLLFLGESVLDPAIGGVATIIYHGTEFLRGYGTFLHPNVTAFFFFSYGLVYFLLEIVPRGTLFPLQNTSNCSTWNTKRNKFWKLFHVEHSFLSKIPLIVPRGTLWIIYAGILIAFLLTFSKSVILITFIIGLGLLLTLNCSTWNSVKNNKHEELFHVEQFFSFRMSSIVPRGTYMLMGLLLLSLVIFSLLSRVPFVQQSILERKLQYLSIPISAPVELLAGQGMGSYVEILSEKSPRLFFWQLQPIHNTYILILFEVGLLPILGIIVYCWIKYGKYYRFSRYTEYSPVQRMVMMGFGGLLLLPGVDHYMWDLEQGQFLMVFLVTVLLFSLRTHYQKTENTI